jgi:hypothetical protein
MNEYKPKPFTKEIADQMKIKMDSEFDEKRTLCNVLKLAYKCSREESFNLEATRALLLEGLWMGQRMSDALTKKRKENVEKELIDQIKDEDPFAVDWSNLDGRNVAQGNWD